MEAKKVICPNCGAAIFENEPACPFCGYINISGAEEKFMHDIKKTEQDMRHIPQLQKAEYKKTISKSSRIIFITVGITALVLAVLLGFPYFMEEVVFSGSERDAKAQMVWNNENYPILDAMYAEGDYDGIIMAYSCFEQIGLSRDYYIKELEATRDNIWALLKNPSRVTGKLRRKAESVDKALCKAITDVLKPDDDIFFEEFAIIFSSICPSKALPFNCKLGCI